MTLCEVFVNDVFANNVDGELSLDLTVSYVTDREKYCKGTLKTIHAAVKQCQILGVLINNLWVPLIHMCTFCITG
jgi:hypothetical protein